jgi:class 3 adenylate cyclase/tetratricopeptide (TPR) repeat protein
MKCPQCQAENPSDMRFCGQCAAPLAAVCPSCGSANPPGNKFCGQCATPLTGATQRFAAPDSYTPQHLAERIINSKAALEGERKQVTVLFADLKGSMELLADRDPEEARKILDPVLTLMMDAVHRYEGTVNQVMGDGIMALFGAPLAHEDHAVRACYAALRMQQSVAQYAEDVFRSHGVPLQIRVGLNSGEVVVRVIGSDLHMDYTAVGQTTHLAARMEQMATPGTTLLAPATLKLAEGYVQVAARGLVMVKGLEEPLEIYALTGANAQRTRIHATAARGLTRFVGRDTEVEHLRRVLGQAGVGHGQVVAIVGEAGVGKSRLTYEFIRSHRVQGWLILESSSVSYGKATSYLPAIDLLKTYFKIGDRDDHREMRAKVLGRVLGLDRALEPLLPPLLALLDIPVEDAAWQALDPLQRRQRTLDAIKRLLLRESQLQPLLVVFEDLHWIDGETQALLDSLVASLGSARVLLLVNYRPEYEHHWGSKTSYSQLRLDTLPTEGAADLLRALLGPDPGLISLTQMLVKRGNPFFLEETVRTLVETGVLAGERGAYRLTRPVTTLQVPTTVQTILAARIDRLPADEKRLLQTASVIGKDVPFMLLQTVAEGSEREVHQRLAHLQAAEFLYETRLFPDSAYTFKHALTHEVAYSGLLHQRRQELHTRILDAIERLYAGRLGEHVERLAHHAVRAEQWAKALSYLRQAGTRAIDQLAYETAVAYFEQAVSAADRFPGDRQALEQSIDLRIDLRTALFPMWEGERLQRHLDTGARLAADLGDPVRLARINAYQAHYWSIIAGPSQPALDHARRALRIAESVGASSLTGLCLFFLGQVQHGAGDFLAAISTLERCIDLMRDELLNERAGLGLPVSLGAEVWLSFALAEVGRFREALTWSGRALKRAEALAQLYSLYHGVWASATVHLALGDHQRVADTVGRLRVEGDLQNGVAPLGAYAHALAGRAPQAVAMLKGFLGHPKWPKGPAIVQHRDLVYLADAHWRAGETEEALEIGQRTLARARVDERHGQEAHLLRILGDAHAAMARDTDALTSYGESLARASERGMRPAVAHCHLGLGKLYRRTDKREQAKEQLSIATTMYRDMGMTYWLEQAEAEMADLQ